MTEGTAEAWKEVFMDEKNRSYRSYTDFIAELKKAFSAANAKGEARAQLRQLRQGKTQQTNILHNSGFLQDTPRSQMTNSLLNTSWKESMQEFCRKSLARTHLPP